MANFLNHLFHSKGYLFKVDKKIDPEEIIRQYLVHELKITAKRTNPISDDEIKLVNAFLDEIQCDTITAELKSKRGMLTTADIKKDNVLRALFNFAKYGYGDYSMKYFDETHQRAEIATSKSDNHVVIVPSKYNKGADDYVGYIAGQLL